VVEPRLLGRRWKPILEVNPRHQHIVALAGLSPDARASKDDTVHRHRFADRRHLRQGAHARA
jgi:hypothetical protein